MATQPEGEFESRMQQAIRYKAEGNQHYKEKRVREAISRYHWALMHLRGLDPSEPAPLQAFGGEKEKLSSEQVELLHSVECDCYNNLAGKWRSPLTAVLARSRWAERPAHKVKECRKEPWFKPESDTKSWSDSPGHTTDNRQ
ncbi:tetratricopeptide repeat protein 9C-like [Leucoraja erinacea]|uniref:tetratricopeptide repeat protein 9C-like n=1 Tax=Leucoraja erinaceus TaxID=7782 RepID=UPI002458C712|nr:tetratricopeptide repeat protein 9C-like [Leucoraja erinacea]